MTVEQKAKHRFWGAFGSLSIRCPNTHMLILQMLIEHLVYARHLFDGVGNEKINDESLQSRCLQPVGEIKKMQKQLFVSTMRQNILPK